MAKDRTWVQRNRQYRGRDETQYECTTGWYITWDVLSETGSISKRGRASSVEILNKKQGYIVKGMGIPNYVVDKANEIMGFSKEETA